MRGAKLAVEAFDEAVLLGLSRRDVMPIDTRFLNPFEDRHAGELSAPFRQIALQSPAGAVAWLTPCASHRWTTAFRFATGVTIFLN